MQNADCQTTVPSPQKEPLYFLQLPSLQAPSSNYKLKIPFTNNPCANFSNIPNRAMPLDCTPLTKCPHKTRTATLVHSYWQMLTAPSLLFLQASQNRFALHRARPNLLLWKLPGEDLPAEAALRYELWILSPLKSLHLLQLQHLHLELSFLLCDAPGPRSIRCMIDEQE